MAKHLDYYENWKSEILHCTECGWKGTFEEGSVDYHSAWLDISCPTCFFLLAIVSYPSDWETEANWDKLSVQEKESFKAHTGFLTAQKKSSLKSEADLPDLDGSSLIITWDFEGSPSGKFTVIRHGEREIWRELAFYEGFDRFKEVAEILMRKYGSRLADLVPTEASEYYLYGDAARSLDVVDTVRKLIQDSHRA
jgi:hypothetical protein